MRHDESAFAELVAERLKQLDTTAFAVEKAHGLPPDAVRNVLRGAKKSGTPLNRAKEICEALGLELYFGPRRSPDPSPPPPIAVDGEDFTTIKRVAAEASAGPGALNGDAEVVGSLAFRKDWLRDRGVKPEKALLVTVTGESMKPSIHPGDLVLLDLDRTEIVNGQPYIFNDADGATRLKRLHRLGVDALALVSDNPEHPPELRNGSDAARVRVIGRVVWSGHSWG